MKELLLLISLTSGWMIAQAPDEYNIPKSVEESWKRGELRHMYEFSSRLNPFYLRGDFNGDGSTDYALLIIEKSSGKRGVAICHGKGGAIAIIGAGASFLRSDGYDYQDFSFEAWRVYEDKRVHQAPEEGPPPKLIGEAILAEWPERGGGIIFWDGKKYAWYHLGG